MSETRELDEVFDELPPNVQQELQALEEIVYQQKRRIAELEFKVKLCEEFKERSRYVAKATEDAWRETTSMLEQQLAELRDDIAGFPHLNDLRQAMIDTAENARLREAVLAYVGPVDDPHIGWRGSSPSHNDLFQCEACGAEDADTRAMQHTDNCTAAALLATIGQKP